jgi:hypothetical protein
MIATLVSADCAQKVRVKDLNSEGAGILCVAPLTRGTDVVLKRGNLFVAARVAWTDGKSAGLEFYRPVDVAELAGNLLPA